MTTNRQNPEATPPQRSLFERLNKFNTKIILVTGLSVIIGALLNVSVARQGIHRLSYQAATEIESGLNPAIREYITNHLDDRAKAVDLNLGQAYQDLQILGAVVQGVIDKEQDLQQVLEAANRAAPLHDNLAYNEKAKWWQNGPEEPAAVSVWGYLGKDGQIDPAVRDEIGKTAILDLLLPAFHKYGASKLQIWYVGPPDRPYLRLTPYTDVAGTFDKLYPGHNDKPWYDFFFSGVVESWSGWLKDPGGLAAHPNQITVTAPYEDAAGGGLVMTAFQPLWSKDRTAFAGTVGLDLTLAQIIESIKDVKLATNGFAFLVQANGNVLAVNDLGAKTLRLRVDSSGSPSEGVGVLQRFIKDSADPQVAAIELPKDDKVQYREITIAGEVYIIALERLAPVNGYAGPGARVAPENWTLAFVVPKREIYASMIAAQNAIEDTRTRLISTQILITVGSIFLLMLGVYIISRRMTRALVELSASAARMREGDYSVRVQVQSGDEIGQLGVAFNEMASEIEAYTNNLEELVSERTRALEKANQEISQLNAKLAQENIRLGAELNVARQLQLMVLPAPQELEQISELDIAGYMAPADEVGGDYYDVLRSDGLVKIGIGDVTGHGLESGVLMLMVQTAVRTLLATGEQDPTRFLSIVNKVIYQNIQRINSNKNMSLTLLDYSSGMIKLTGQHEDLIIVRKDGSLERFDTMGLGMPIGLDLEIEDFISSAEIMMEPGDLVALFSDGITEAEDASSQQYGIDRLCEVIRKNHQRTSKEIKDAIIEDVLAHIGYNKVYDDITVLVIKRV